MSTTMHWRYADPPPPPAGTVDGRVKRVIAQTYLGHDGTLSGDVVFDKSDLGWLRGVYATLETLDLDRDRHGSDLNQLAELITAISKHGAIELWIDS